MHNLRKVAQVGSIRKIKGRNELERRRCVREPSNLKGELGT